MANLHIEGSTEIDDSGKTLTDLKDMITKVDEMYMRHNVIKERHIYNTPAGASGYYRILRMPPNGGYNGYAVIFQAASYNHQAVGLGYFECYNNTNAVGKYIAHNSGIRFYWKRESDNSIYIYMYLNSYYAPTIYNVLMAYGVNGTFLDPHKGANATYLGDTVSGLTEFGSL